ncbi:MAG: caspase family protein [Nitrospirae bacterium]|nr:MAG: caspase family protein [Nitrospirota bacterium]
MYASSASVTLFPQEALAKAGVVTLAQGFESVDLVTDKASAAGHYDLYIELTAPRIGFTQDCHDVETAILYVIIIGAFVTANGSPDFYASVDLTATVTDREGTVLLKETPFHAARRILYGNMAVNSHFPGEAGQGFQYLMAGLFREMAGSMTNSAKLRQYARSIRREPSGVVSQPLPASAAPPFAGSSDLDSPPVGGVKTSKNRHAVVIGIEQYRKKLPQADYAANDARVMADYLSKVLGYPEENIALLLNDNAAKTDLEKYFEGWLPNRVEKGDSVFVYFSGHGAPNPKTGKAYLVPYDGDPSFVEQTAYPLDRLYDRLGKLPAKEIVVVLDSCFSGAGGRSVIAKGMRPMVLSIENPVLAGGKTAVLAASSGEQVSSTYDEKKHGLLTYFLLKGLRGEADRGQSGDIGLNELFDYVKPLVERTARREFNNEQVPQLLESPELLKRGVRLLERPKP